MFVLGVDPGLSRCGYCALDLSTSPARILAIGVIRTPAGDPVPARLWELQADIRSILRQIGPAVVAIERVLFQVNVQTAMAVGQASGIVMAESVAAGAEVVEYSPNQVKLAVAGHGKADKNEVGEMVRRLLALSAIPEPADAADAAAIALCHGAFASFSGATKAATAMATATAKPVADRNARASTAPPPAERVEPPTLAVNTTRSERVPR